MAVALRAPLQLRRAIYASRGGFLVRPFIIAVVLGAAGVALSSLERNVFPTSTAGALPSGFDPQIAQVILSDIATSIMTVVSIVFAILLMTLTLASMQFSPRILLNFVRDQVTQWTLGVFLGTFCYCMAALPAVSFAPRPFSPVMTVTGAMGLALVCVGWLLFFIHHISHAISVNHMIDRIARDTEVVIDQIAPHPRTLMLQPIAPDETALAPEGVVLARTSGYIRFIDGGALLAVATAARSRIRVCRRVGHFVAAGTPLFFVSPLDRLGDPALERLHTAFDLGPVRTLQQDVEFGVLQIVDIALRAISPAVNDPSTAIGCIDQLSRLMIRWLARNPPATLLASPPHVVRVVFPWIADAELLETAFDQIRYYAARDIAVSLRLLRALNDIALAAPDPATGALLAPLGLRIVEGFETGPDGRDRDRLETRLGALRPAGPPRS